MKYKNGAIIGGIIALFFYTFLTGITPYAEHSIIPTGYVVSDAEGFKSYVSNLPKSTVMFISLEVVGIILGVIGYKIISDAQQFEE